MQHKFQSKISKHQKRREANANERKRIKQLNDAIKRLKEATNQSSTRLGDLINHGTRNEKTKKSRKMTKLSIIKAAINHIYTLQEMLTEDEQTDIHQTNDNLDGCLSIYPTSLEQNILQESTTLIPFNILATESRKNIENFVRENSIKTEESVSNNFELPDDGEKQYLIVEESEEYKIIPIEREYTTLVYLDCFAQ